MTDYDGKSMKNDGKSTAGTALGPGKRGKQWHVFGVFARKFHYGEVRNTYKMGCFSLRGARKERSNRKTSPHRPTPASDLPDLP